MLWVGLALALATPYFFIFGLYLGRRHVRRLATNGGEERYPAAIAQYVRTYRQEKQYYIESLRYTKNNDN